MTDYVDAFSDRPAIDLRLRVTESNLNEAANTSRADFTLYMDPSGATTSYHLDNNCTWSVSINGVNFSGNFSYDFRSSTAAITIGSGNTTVTHNADGSKSIAVSASANGLTPAGTAATSGTFVMTDFVKVPAAPTAGPTLSRNAAGTTITVLSDTATSPTTITDYQYQQSTNGTTWGAATSMGTDKTIDITGLTATQIYYYQTRAVNSDGAGPWSATKYTAGAPASITATRTGRNVTVVAGNANGTVSAYYVQYSINSGVDWTTPVAMTAQSYTYSALTPALTYIFRVYAVGDGTNTSYATSSGVFVPAGGKRWDGSAWNSTATGKRWNGSAWVDLTIAKRWNGSAWVDLS